MLCGGKEAEQRHVQHFEDSCSLIHTAANRRAQHRCLLLLVPTLSFDSYDRTYKTAQKIREVTGSLALLLHGNEFQGNKAHFTCTGCFLQLAACALGQRSSNLSYHSCSLIPAFFCSISLCVFPVEVQISIY